MIDKSHIIKLVDEHCDGKEIYPVEIAVSSHNKIIIYIDADQGVSIEDCIGLSRFVEHSLDREVEDFELEVTSAGLDQPLKIPRQYQKNISRKVKITLTDGSSFSGILLSANDQGFTAEVEKKIMLEGKKKKQLIKEEISFLYQDIQSTKIEISFK